MNKLIALLAALFAMSAFADNHGTNSAGHDEHKEEKAAPVKGKKAVKKTEEKKEEAKKEESKH